VPKKRPKVEGTREHVWEQFHIQVIQRRAPDARAFDHANPKPPWEQMGKPEYLPTAMVAELNAASQLRKVEQTMQFSEGRSNFDVELPLPSVATIEFAC
jgi:hypothetical protein